MNPPIADNDNMRGIVILLCNLTDAMATPWIEGGYEVVMIDPQHGETSSSRGVTRVAGTIVESADLLGELIRSGRVVFVAGFPPCTDVAVSGARWFEAKRLADPYFQAKAAIVAEQCRMTGLLSGAPWMWENPVSVFTNIFGPAHHTFHPYEYTQLCADDNYTKKTCLRVGGGFRMPPKCPDLSLGKPDNRIHAAPPGEDRANFRSAFPVGFSRAVYLANAPHLRCVPSAANDNHQFIPADLKVSHA
ncbi:hypothetical protein RGK87_04570 [Agrobacterium fabacearum]|uniref:hypothetical protein n=1 Tax=Agrobacterium tumefaciens TaxID=358 RepID=UPI002853194A|nr:hypothetical protein [Agrobacterium tumefaciens]MDR5008282.1 hypothetical protein [Agrobacterium tumefaciens]